MIQSGLDRSVYRPEAFDVALKIVEEIQRDGYSSTYQRLLSIDYLREPVDIETFLFDPYYMGSIGRGLYSKWVEVLFEVFDPNKQYHELIFTGSIGSGKSTCSCVALAYKLYQLSCLKSPAEYFGLLKGTNIIFGIYNVFKYKAEDNYGVLKTFIEHSPYFRDCCPTLKMKNKTAKDGIYFDNGVSVICGSNELHALGLNLFSLVIDEANFMRVPNSKAAFSLSQAQKLYTATKRRLESRYMYKGVIPGLMIVISSRNVETSWLEEHIREVNGSGGVYVADFPIWEAKKDVMGYSGRTFKVEIGDSFVGSRILGDGEVPREGARVIEVPVEHLEPFQRDVEASLRDLAGVATVPHSVFIHNREHIQKCINPDLKHPFTRESIVISNRTPEKIVDFFKWKDVTIVVNSVIKPRLNPNAIRHIHIDLAEKHDNCGVCMGHVSHLVGTQSRITLDFMLRIAPPKQGSIDFSKIREFIVYLRDELGFPIKSVSVDSYQSADTRQILEKLGFVTSVVSVDRTDEVYTVFRGVLYENRLEFYEYKPVIDELLSLIYDAERKKVDHPMGGSKDCADAVASVVFCLCRAVGKDRSLGRAKEARELLPMTGMQIDLLDIRIRNSLAGF